MPIAPTTKGGKRATGIVRIISRCNGTNEGYFEDYKGGIVSIVCNETGEEVYSERVK